MLKSSEIINTLEEMYPNAECELNHDSAFQLAVAVVLSAQTTDARVNIVTKELFSKYPTYLELKDATIKEIENCIKSIGLYHNKAISIKGLAQVLNDQFNGIMPSNMEDLLKLPGVGRKSANVIMSVCFNIPAIAVDTHVERVSKRLGLAYKNDSVLEVENKLMRKIEKNKWNRAHHLFIFFGRYFCKAKNPDCSKCPFFEQCKDKIKYTRLD